MKKFRILGVCVMLATLLLSQPLAALEMNVITRFDSEHVINGVKCGKEKMEVSAEMAADFLGGSGYLGFDSRFMARGDAKNKVAPYVGYYHTVDGVFDLDMGYQSYFYTNLEESPESEKSPERAKNHGDEIFFGVLFNQKIPLATYLSYNFTEDDVCIFASVAGDCNLSCFGLENCFIESRATVGYDRCGRPSGIRGFFTGKLKNARKDFGFYAVDLNFVYSRRSQSAIRTGVHLAGNSASQGSYVNSLGGHQNLLWLTSAVEFMF
ncbi:MAG: hypothetical protein LBG86_00305 [Puniceicoccales bacterium]|jgi:hypothetical protein|nr:hypothetical protein [Puniceicoccales bacterium]